MTTPISKSDNRSDNKLPSFLFYPADWITDLKVRRMSLEAQGAYFNLLCLMWINSKDQCSLDSDPVILCRILGDITQPNFRKVWGEIQKDGDPIFIEHNGKIISKRLREERNKYLKFKEMKSKAGKVGMYNRWHNKPITEPITKDNFSLSPSLSPSKELKDLSIASVQEYFKSKGSNTAEADKFFNYYESNGWKVGKNPMKNWRAAAAGWISRSTGISAQINGSAPAKKTDTWKCFVCNKDVTLDGKRKHMEIHEQEVKNR